MAVVAGNYVRQTAFATVAAALAACARDPASCATRATSAWDKGIDYGVRLSRYIRPQFPSHVKHGTSSMRVSHRRSHVRRSGHRVRRAGKRRSFGRKRRTVRKRGGGWKRPPTKVTRGGFSSRAYGRKDAHYYTPPMGKIKLTKRRLGPGDSFKVQLIEKLSMTAQANKRLEFEQWASHFMYGRTDGVSPRPNCPEIYRILQDYESFTVTGLKMEVFTQPSFIGSASTANVQWQGGAYSLTHDGNQTIKDQGDTSLPTSVYPLYINQQDATRDSSFRRESFGIGSSTSGMPKRKRIFSRYQPFPYVRQHKEGVNTINTDANPQINVPTLVMVQKDQQVIYFVDNITVVVPTGTDFQYEQVGTLYFKCFDRRPKDPDEIPVYMKPRIEQILSVGAVSMPTDPAY